MEFWHFGVPSVSGVERMAQRCEELNFDGLTLTDCKIYLMKRTLP